MMKQITQTASATAMKGSVAIDWHIVLSEVSTTVKFYNLKKGLLISEEDVKDVVQESCEKIFLHLYEYEPSKSKLSTWMSKIAVNSYFDALRDSIRRNSIMVPFSKNCKGFDSKIESPNYCSDGNAIAAELEELLTLALEPLCERYRKAIRCIIDKVPEEEMFIQLGCSSNIALRSTLSRARSAVRSSFVALGII